VPPISFRGATKCWPCKASPPRSHLQCAAFSGGRRKYEPGTSARRSISRAS
jgi:hypothetical protein